MSNPLQRLIRCTPLGTIRRLRWSAQRFELDSYHGDALPTELTGPVFRCLSWGFASLAVVSGRAHRSHSVESNIVAKAKARPTGVGELSALLPSWRLHLEAANLARTIRAYTDDVALLVAFPDLPGHARRRAQHPPGAHRGVHRRRAGTRRAIVCRDALPVPSAAL